MKSIDLIIFLIDCFYNTVTDYKNFFENLYKGFQKTVFKHRKIVRQICEP